MRFFLGAALAGLSLLFSPTAAQAQHGRQVRRFDSQGRPYYRGPLRLTAGLGGAMYNGDLGGLPESFVGPAASLGVLYRLRPHLLIGSEFSYFEMGARDRLPERGVAFYSNHGMLTTFLRYDLLSDPSAYVASGSGTLPFQLYLQGGLGALLYNPRSYLGKSRPSSTTQYLPAERNDYPGMALVAPVGGGVSIRLNDEMRVGVEGAYYFSTSDHLDDVSKRGNPDQNDGFGTLLLKFDYTL
ncbi:hypothetical protein GCM10023185_25340 [Hymenobacter saemangeumensis]|uniref:Outer membrane protein beta-barrel domain-containing protein n=1 Tax=Hymenobacter saemangeumensis TaxID=1084522 RepID=A0ABP8IHP8_9BACT